MPSNNFLSIVFTHLYNSNIEFPAPISVNHWQQSLQELINTLLDL